LGESSAIEVHLGANVVEVATAAGGTTVSHMAVRTLSGNEYSVSAASYVLALGGIENARLLLASRASDPAGLGNTGDLVGRYFMDHIEGSVATLVTPLEAPSIYLGGRFDLARAALRPSEELLRSEELAGVAFVMDPLDAPAGAAGGEEVDLASVSAVLGAVTGRGTRAYSLGIRAEPEPNPESRITLIEARDSLGTPRVDVHRVLTAGDHRRLRRSVEVLAKEIGAAGTGWIRVEDILDGTDEPLQYGWHHMGTTRMGTDPRSSVVDPDCRLHSTDNLWIAGSSVFPSAGYANPTLTIVALALRLADHLAGR
ncbi:MAG: GMC oxidoreductase, partial [Microthrixaceae bacterium]